MPSTIRQLQDVGLNGLSSDEEKEYPAYQDYLNKLRQKLNAVTLTEMENDPLQLSPFFDPAGDKFHYFRGSDYDSQEVDILTRYKRYNGRKLERYQRFGRALQHFFQDRA